jgi:hypothetical protein
MSCRLPRKFAWLSLQSDTSRWAVLALVAVCLLPGREFAHAQSERRQLSLSIGDLNSSAKTCGITETLIKEAIMHSANSSQLQFVDDAKAPTFQVRVGTFQSGAGLCVSPIDCRFFIRQKAPRPYDELDLWVGGSLAQSGKDQHAQAVTQHVKACLKAFLAQWDADKRPQ